MLLYNLIRLTLATGLITFLISKDVDKRKLFTVVYTGIFLLFTAVSLIFTVHISWYAAFFTEFMRMLLQLAAAYIYTERGFYYFIKESVYYVLFNLIFSGLTILEGLLLSNWQHFMTTLAVLDGILFPSLLTLLSLLAVWFLIRLNFFDKIPYNIMKFLFISMTLLDLGAGLVIRTSQVPFHRMLAVCLLVFFLWILFLTVFIFFRHRYKSEARSIYQEILENQYAFYQNIQADPDEVRKLRHDLSNHLQILGHMSSCPQNTEIQEYRRTLMQTLYNTPQPKPESQTPGCKHTGHQTSSDGSRGIRPSRQSPNGHINMPPWLVARGNKSSPVKRKNFIYYIICIAIMFFCILGFWVFIFPPISQNYSIYEWAAFILMSILLGVTCLIISIYAKAEYTQRRTRQMLENAASLKMQWDEVQKMASTALSGKTNEFSFQKEQIYFTSLPVINTVLNIKHRYCRQHKILPVWHIYVPPVCQIEPVDMAGLLVNLIDNGIEACLRLPEDKRKLTVQMQARANFWIIEVENSKLPSEHPTQNGFHSMKGEGHGLGHQIVMDLVHKYNGEIQYIDKGNIFLTTVMLDVMT